MTAEGAQALYRLVVEQRRRLVRQLGAVDAEDALAETYLAAFRALEGGAAIRDLASYVSGIARVKAVNEIRRRQASRGRLLPLYPGIPDRRPDPEQMLIEAERREEAGRILDRLPEAKRELLVRFYVREQAQETIRAEMGLSVTRFRLLKSRALRRVARFHLHSLAA